MKKTVKTLSVLLMAMAMSLCFFVAGGLFVKAEVAATTTDKLVAVDGASVLVVDDVADTGIKFDIEISAEDFQALSTKATTEEADLFLGVQVGTEVNGKFVALYNGDEVEEINVSLNGKNLVADNEEIPTKYQYSFSITYNLDRIFGETVDAEKVNQMYSFELAVKPYYTFVKGGEIVEKAYAQAGDARSMLHVAQAEIASGAALPAGFADKYIAETVTTQRATVYTDGTFEVDNGDYEVVSYTIGTNGATVATGIYDVIDASLLAGYVTGQEIQFFGYTADRKVIAYQATYEIPTTIRVSDQVVIAKGTNVSVGSDDEGLLTNTEEDPYKELLYIRDVVVEGGLFFNGVKDLAGNSLEGLMNEIDTISYGDQVIYANGQFDLSALEEVELGTSLVLTAVAGEYTYLMTDVLYATAAFENTKASREDFAALFSSNNLKDGYYVLLENLYFDINSYYEMVANGSGATWVNPVDGGTRTGAFCGTFDGRGYALNNVILGVEDFSQYGLFGGELLEGATFKNFAINEIWRRDRISNTVSRDSNAYGAIFAARSQDADGVPQAWSMENVYIYRYVTKHSLYERGFFYSYNSGDGEPVNMNNVMLVLEFGDSVTDARQPVFGTHNNPLDLNGECYTNNTYIVTNGTRGDMGYGGIKYYESANGIANIADIYKAMADANNDYSEMLETGYWKLDANGLPVWKSIVETNVDGNYVRTINSTNKKDAFTVNAVDGGVNASASDITLESSDTSIVTVSGNVIKVQDDVKGSANVSIFYKGNFVELLPVNVDTWYYSSLYQVVDEATEEKVETQGVSTTVSGGTYTIYVAGSGENVDASDISVSVSGDEILTLNGNRFTITGTASGTATVTVSYRDVVRATYEVKLTILDLSSAVAINNEFLVSELDGALYLTEGTALADQTIVDAYLGSDIVFSEGKLSLAGLGAQYNTALENFIVVLESGDMYKLTNVKWVAGAFNQSNYNSLGMFRILDSSSADYVSGGYYVLTSNIDCNKAKVTKAVSDIGFDGTFDGRGYTIKNIQTDTYNGIFGDAFNDFTVKNVAIYAPTSSTNYMSLLFGSAGAVTVTIDNVYIYYTNTSAKTNHYLSTYSGYKAGLTFSMTNCIWEIDAVKGTSKSASFFRSTGNKLEATNCYFLNNSSGSIPTISGFDKDTMFYGGNMTIAEARAELATAVTDYSTFNSDCWDLTGSTPVWKSIQG